MGKRAGTWKTFEKRFDPQETPDGSLMWDEVPAGTDDRLVWTIVDCDGTLYAVAGYAFVNRLSYIVCAKPWPDEELLSPGYRY